MSARQNLLAIFTLLVSTAALGASPVIESLGEDECHNEPFHGWFLSWDEKSTPLQCILALPNSSHPEHYRIKLDGSVVELHPVPARKLPKHRESWSDVEAFRSLDGSISVALYSRISHDGCQDTDGKCCTVDHAGELVVSTNKGKVRIQVWSSEGG